MWDPNIIATVLSVAIAIGTFFIGRQTSAKTSGQQWGELVSDVKYIKKNMDDMKCNLSADIQLLRDDIAKERDARNKSIQRLHDKFDEHISDYHGGKS